MQDMISMLLRGAVETLDISPTSQAVAIARYDEVGTWLAETGGHRVRIYPQGSFRLGTVVRPRRGRGEYDIDLVFLLEIAKESTTQNDLKERVGELLDDFLKAKKEQGDSDGPATREPRRRCWTLTFPEYGFHLDVLPAVPDAELLPDGICLTDKELTAWQKSNPLGYARWFALRSAELQDLLKMEASARHVKVDEVPVHDVRSTLQRVVQVLKWHAMEMFADKPDLRPPSILLTTLAAHAYRGDRDLFTAARSIVENMTGYVENRNGVFWVPNPAHEEENFTDKWREYPERRTAFYRWHGAIGSTLDSLAGAEGRGLHALRSMLTKSFSAEPVDAAYSSLIRNTATSRTAGNLRMAGTGALGAAASGPRVRDHIFHGQHPQH